MAMYDTRNMQNRGQNPMNAMLMQLLMKRMMGGQKGQVSGQSQPLGNVASLFNQQNNNPWSKLTPDVIAKLIGNTGPMW